jgi:large conductance mechanosensitive channel
VSLLKDFKEFAVRGNVLDMAIGVIIGISFGKIVTSLVNDVMMPPLGALIGGIDFSGLILTIGGASIKYGAFINTVVDFAIVALIIFLVVRSIKVLKKPGTAATTKECPECLLPVPINAKRCGHCTSTLR